MKVKIINILMHPPGYELYGNTHRPKCNWDTVNGDWVGIWGGDWPDLLGKEILKRTGEFDYEVWQPDIKADQVYECSFPGGLKHVLFPASRGTRLFGCKPVERIFSHALVRFLLNARQNGKIVLHINDPPPHFGAVLKHFSNCPVILSYLGEINVPITQLFSRTKNLPSKINNFLDHLSFLKYINKINVITYSNNKNLDYLRRFYQGRMERLTMGCDFSFWKAGDRSAARHRLNLNGRTTVFFSSTNLISTKQIDKSIAAFIGLNHRYDYIYIVSGHGTGVYEDYLKSLSRPLAAQGRIKFVGYVSDDDLLDYYNAADYFILPSQNEGASVSIIKALACGIPVISTAVGGTAELMAEHNAGYLLDQDHRSWPGILEDILSGHKKITSLDREVVRKNYDWAEVTEKFIRIYRRLTSEYYDRKNSVAVLPQPERT